MYKIKFLDGIEREFKTLVSADLRGVDLRGVNLEGADLVRAKLAGADLRYANLVGTDLTNADLRGANLLRANLVNAYLVEANLNKVNLTEADLRGARLKGANLEGADLYCANIEGTCLRDKELKEQIIDKKLITSDDLKKEGTIWKYRWDDDGTLYLVGTLEIAAIYYYVLIDTSKGRIGPVWEKIEEMLEDMEFVRGEL